MRDVPIPGGTAVLLDPEEITEGRRRYIKVISAQLGSGFFARLAEVDENTLEAVAETDREAELILRLQDATIVAFLKSWSLEEPLPTMATVTDLPTALYDALAQATREAGAQVASAADSEVSADPEASTPASAG